MENKKQELSTGKWESEAQRIIDKQLQSKELKDMHLESGEKINDYDVEKD
jgi:hypothetical protein